MADFRERLQEAAAGPGLAALGLGAAIFWAAAPLVAQGVTGAAIGGRVLAPNGTPLEEASVHVVNASDGGTVQLLELVGYDPPNGRGVYQLVPVFRRQIDPDASRWRLQLGSTLFF